MEPQDYLDNVRRDAMLVAAIYRALFAMQLTNGCSISRSGINAVLNFDNEVVQLQRALNLLAVDPTEQFPPPTPGGTSK